MYRSPRLRRYGTMRALTRGATGSVSDTSDTGDPFLDFPDSIINPIIRNIDDIFTPDGLF